jgi:hypothetical protein
MAVYVDLPIWNFGRMRMCHMIADTTEELLQMADRLDVNQKWIQNPGMAREHFDICKSKRAQALKLGAISVPASTLVELIRRKSGPLTGLGHDLRSFTGPGGPQK